MNKRKMSAAVLMLSFFFAASVQPVWSQENDAASVAEIEYHIPSGSLSQALIQFSVQSGLQLIAPSELTEGHASPGLNGRYSASAALAQLLAGSGLGFRLDGARNIVTLFAAQQPGGGNQLGAVKVEGSQMESRGGANGSSDITATEGTDSYSTTAISVGSKMAQSLRETPQSVSVITQKQMQDQNVTDLNTAMSKLPGITIRQSNSGEQEFHSRGWQIGTVQIDGGTPFKITNSTSYDKTKISPTFDISMYDHIELMRGGDGINNVGSSTPGGTINLVRKRPLDHNQVLFSASAGTWDNYRSSLDVTGPLAFDGRLRGRAVVTWQDKDYFYDVADETKRLAYGVLEADLTPTTVMRLGASYDQTKSTPWGAGLPRYTSGEDPALPRHTSYALPWSRLKISTTTVFAALEQEVSENWKFSTQLNRQSQKYSYFGGTVAGSLPDPGTSNGGQYLSTIGDESEGTQWLGDVNLTGKFDLFSLPQRLSLTGSHQRSEYSNQDYDFDYGSLPDVALIDTPETGWRKWASGKNYFTQSNAVASLDSVFLPFLPDLHFQTALRRDRYSVVHDHSLQSGAVKSKETRNAIPYYALRYDFTPEFSVYGSYTKVYEFQSNYFDDTGTPLPPMTGGSREIGVKFNRGSLNASLALYKAWRQNMAIPDTLRETCGPLGSDFCYGIAGREMSKGVDFEISGEPLPWWSVYLGYTFNLTDSISPYDASFRSPLSSITPKHQLKLWNDFRLSGNPYLARTRVGLGVIAQSESYTTGSVCNADYSECVDQQYKQGFYAVTSARATYQVDKNWSLGVNINNIFDRNYYKTLGDSFSGNWYGEPRNVVLTVDGKF